MGQINEQVASADDFPTKYYSANMTADLYV